MKFFGAQLTKNELEQPRRELRSIRSRSGDRNLLLKDPYLAQRYGDTACRNFPRRGRQRQVSASVGDYCDKQFSTKNSWERTEDLLCDCPEGSRGREQLEATQVSPDFHAIARAQMTVWDRHVDFCCHHWPCVSL